MVSYIYTIYTIYVYIYIYIYHLSRNTSLREKPQMFEQKLLFNINYYTSVQSVRTIMEELHILLTPNEKHEKVFPNVPVIGFRNGKRIIRIT